MNYQPTSSYYHHVVAHHPNHSSMISSSINNNNHHHFNHHHPISLHQSSQPISFSNNNNNSNSRTMDWNLVQKNYLKPCTYAVKTLQLQMHEIHLSYISRDYGTLRSKSREKLDSLMQEYLKMIPHIQKFSFVEIWDCLEMTVLNSNSDEKRNQQIMDFDPEKLIHGFEAIERYALNLLNFPWRPEFQKIFAFSGYFHRSVRCSLIGYEKIFTLMGYRYNSQLDIYQLQEIPIDPDKMIQISFECLIACAEIRLMMEIKFKCPEMTWKDIYSIRCEYICNPQQAIQLFEDLKRNSKLIELDLPDYSCKKFDTKFENFTNQNRILLPTSSSSQTIATTTANKNNNYDVDVKKMMNCKINNDFNHHHSNVVVNDDNDNVDDQCIVPPPPNYLESDLDSIDFIDSTTTPPTNEQKIDAHNDDDDDEDDDLKHANSIMSFFNSKNDTLVSSHHNNNNRKTITIKNPSRDLSTSLMMSNSSSTSTSMTSTSPIVSSSKMFNEIETKKTATSPRTTINKSNEIIIKCLDNNKNEQKNQSKWNCSSCTFANESFLEICAICHRSRKKGNELKPLATGGRECNQCTLVNDKNEQYCRACDTSLADSPTYI